MTTEAKCEHVMYDGAAAESMVEYNLQKPHEFFCSMCMTRFVPDPSDENPANAACIGHTPNAETVAALEEARGLDKSEKVEKTDSCKHCTSPFCAGCECYAEVLEAARLKAHDEALELAAKIAEGWYSDWDDTPITVLRMKACAKAIRKLKNVSPEGDKDKVSPEEDK